MSQIIENAKSKLRALRERMLQGRDPRNASVLAYHRSRTPRNLLWLLRAAGPIEGLEGVQNRLKACSRACRCGFYGCPTCGPKLRRKHALDALKAIVAKYGRVPERNIMSFVTIRASETDLIPAAALASLKQLKQRIRKLQNTTALRQTSWVGWFDVSLSGVVHWHGVVVHPDMSAAALRTRLKAHFRAPRAVKVSGWKKAPSDVENLHAVLKYSLPAERHTKLIKDRPRYGVNSSMLIAKRLVCLHRMTSIGVRGIRLVMNMGSHRIWKAGVMFDPKLVQTIAIPEVEKLILARRRRAKRTRSP